jgi:hypothetical protein
MKKKKKKKNNKKNAPIDYVGSSDYFNSLFPFS